MRSYRKPWWYALVDHGFFPILVITVFLVVVLQAGCGQIPSESRARHALETQGFSDIRLIKRHIWFVGLTGCGRDDSVKFEFQAINPANRHVRVEVCEGVFKGATIRG